MNFLQEAFSLNPYPQYAVLLHPNLHLSKIGTRNAVIEDTKTVHMQIKKEMAAILMMQWQK